MSKQSSTRVYLVWRKTGGISEPRLVEAYSTHQAISHVVHDTYEAEVATQKTLITLLGKGVKVEKAGKPEQTDAFKQNGMSSSVGDSTEVPSG